MVRTDIMHRLETGVNPNEAGFAKIDHQTTVERPAGKNELRAMIGKSTAFKKLRPSSQCLLRELINRAGPFQPDDGGAEILHVDVYADEDGRRGRSVLADSIGVSVKTIERSLEQLAEAGFVVACQRPGWRYRLNSYTVVVPKEIIAEYRQRQAARKRRKVSQSQRQTVAVTASDCREHGDKMSLSSCSSAFLLAHKEETTTKARAASPRPVASAGPSVVVVNISRDDEAEKAIAELRRRGVEAIALIRKRLTSGSLHVDEIHAVIEHADAQDNDIGGPLIFNWLTKPEHAPDRAEWTDDYRAKRQRRIDRKAAEQRQHVLVNRIRSVGMNAREQAAAVTEAFGGKAEHIVASLSAEDFAALEASTDDELLPRLLVIAEQRRIDEQNAREQQQAKAEADRIEREQRDAENKAVAEAKRRRLHDEHIAKCRSVVEAAADEQVIDAYHRAGASLVSIRERTEHPELLRDVADATNVRELVASVEHVAEHVAAVLLADERKAEQRRKLQGVA